MTDTVTTTQVWVRFDLGDGSDPAEIEAHLPAIPRKGDALEVWIDEGRDTGFSHPEWLDVKYVAFCTYAPDRIEVWVSTDGHSNEDMERIAEALRGNEQP